MRILSVAHAIVRRDAHAIVRREGDRAALPQMCPLQCIPLRYANDSFPAYTIFRDLKLEDLLHTPPGRETVSDHGAPVNPRLPDWGDISST
jgi:hypothetical protein